MKRFITSLLVAASLLIASCSSVTTLINKPAEVGSTVKVVNGGGHGSGVHLEDGLILTAAHVVIGKTELEIFTQDGVKQTGKVLWVDKTADLALIKIKSYENLQTREIVCTPAVRGSEVTADGNPITLDFILSQGIIASTPFKLGDWERSQIVDMTILPGMSGGPVYQDGKVVGIVVGVNLYNIQSGNPFAGEVPNVTGFGIIIPGDKLCEELAEHGQG